MNLPSWLVPPLCVVAFLIWWSFVCWGLSLVSGWGKMGKQFRAPGKPPGQPLYMQSGQFNGVRYNNGLTIIVAPQGLYLSVLFLFMPGHPPLLIPWSALSAFKTGKQLWVTLHTTTVTLGQFNKVTIAFYNQNLVAAINAHLPSREN